MEEQSSIDETVLKDDPFYWLGWLASALGEGLRKAYQVNEDGEPQYDPEFVHDQMLQSLEAYAEGPLGEHASKYLERMFVGFVVEDRTGEAHALRRTWAQAEQALESVQDYWFEAETCGHPKARKYVEGLLPFRIRQITRAERDEILEAGVPTIDREP